MFTAPNERSFDTLKSIKNDLISTICAERLQNCMLLNKNQDITDTANNFITKWTNLNFKK